MAIQPIKKSHLVRILAATIVLFQFGIIAACTVKDTLPAVNDATKMAVAAATPTRPWCPTASPSPTVFVLPPGPPPPPPPTPTRQPPTPTGPRPTPMPLPTLKQVPATATTLPVVFPTEPPLNLVTPVANWVTYRNLDVSFSFDYPANWQIEAPDQSCRPLAPTGTAIEIRNYNINTAVEKGLLLPEMLRVRIGVGPHFADYGTVDQWAMRLRGEIRDPGIGYPPSGSYSPIERLTVSGLPAVRWTWKGTMLPVGAVDVLIGKGIWSYDITAYPASSREIATFERILSSFQIP